MNRFKLRALSAAAALVLAGIGLPAEAAVYVQCPGDNNGDAVPDIAYDPDQLKCMHLGAGDGFINMADGRLQYMFGFSDLTGLTESQVMEAGHLLQPFLHRPLL